MNVVFVRFIDFATFMNVVFVRFIGLIRSVMLCSSDLSQKLSESCVIQIYRSQKLRESQCLSDLLFKLRECCVCQIYRPRMFRNVVLIRFISEVV